MWNIRRYLFLKCSVIFLFTKLKSIFTLNHTFYAILHTIQRPSVTQVRVLLAVLVWWTWKFSIMKICRIDNSQLQKVKIAMIVEAIYRKCVPQSSVSWGSRALAINVGVPQRSLLEPTHFLYSIKVLRKNIHRSFVNIRR